jgi:hypothetical protein
LTMSCYIYKWTTYRSDLLYSVFFYSCLLLALDHIIVEFVPIMSQQKCFSDYLVAVEES